MFIFDGVHSPPHSLVLVEVQADDLVSMKVPIVHGHMSLGDPKSEVGCTDLHFEQNGRSKAKAEECLGSVLGNDRVWKECFLSGSEGVGKREYCGGVGKLTTARTYLLRMTPLMCKAQLWRRRGRVVA